MKNPVLAAGLFSIIALILCASLFPVVEAARDQPKTTYTGTVSIQGLPESLSTTVYLDGNRWGEFHGGSKLKFDFKLGITHTVSVDQVVNGSSGVSYTCESNVVTFLGPGPEYPFNYTLVEPIPEFTSPILLVAVLVMLLTVCRSQRRTAWNT